MLSVSVSNSRRFQANKKVKERNRKGVRNKNKNIGQHFLDFPFPHRKVEHKNAINDFSSFSFPFSYTLSSSPDYRVTTTNMLHINETIPKSRTYQTNYWSRFIFIGVKLDIGSLHFFPLLFDGTKFLPTCSAFLVVCVLFSCVVSTRILVGIFCVSLSIDILYQAAGLPISIFLSLCMSVVCCVCNTHCVCSRISLDSRCWYWMLFLLLAN